MKDVNSFINLINNNKEKIAYSEDEVNKSKKIYRKDEMLTTIIISFDTFAINETTSSSLTLSLTRTSLIVISLSTGIACGITLSSKIMCEIALQKYNRLSERGQNKVMSSV